jgi:processive 1,2-diacylglycerol beta-glucosyltransferase
MFDALGRIAPSALVATEVGCLEIAALAARDLRLRIPVVAVNGEYDADRAWIQPEVALYSVADASVRDRFVAAGADPSRVRAWGVPVHAAFVTAFTRAAAKRAVCAAHRLDPARPLVLVAGGSEGLGDPVASARAVLAAHRPAQVLLLAGRSAEVRRRAASLEGEYADRVRVIGWTAAMPDLLAAADLLVSKLGHIFDEAIARQLPIVALPPPPGAEHVQWELLERWGVGRAVPNLPALAAEVDRLLGDADARAQLRDHATCRGRANAAREIARWLQDARSVPAEVTGVAPRPTRTAAWSGAGA